MHLLHVIVAISAVISPAEADPSGDFKAYTLEELVAGHESMRNRLNAIDVGMSQTSQKFKSGEKFGPPEARSWQWTRKGKRERFRMPDPSNDDESKVQHQDIFTDGTTLETLIRWDSDAPPQITPLFQQGVHGSIAPLPEGTKPVVFEPARFLLWTFSLGQPERLTLRQLVERSPDVRLVGPAQIDGHQVWHIQATLPKTEGVQGSFDIYIDPEKSFAVRRVIEHYREEQKKIDGKLETYASDVTRTVTKFQEIAPDVFIPAQMTSRVETTTSDRRSVESEMTITLRSAKPKKVEQELDFRFPEHLIVTETIPDEDGQQRKLWLWGPENKPVKEIKHPEDIPGFKEMRRKQGLPDPPT